MPTLRDENRRAGDPIGAGARARFPETRTRLDAMSGFQGRDSLAGRQSSMISFVVVGNAISYYGLIFIVAGLINPRIVFGYVRSPWGSRLAALFLGLIIAVSGRALVSYAFWPKPDDRSVSSGRER